MGPRRDRSNMSRTHQTLQRIPLEETKLLKDYLIKNPVGHEGEWADPQDDFGTPLRECTTIINKL